MSKDIKVSLDQSVTPPVLKLEHYGHAHMDKAATPQTITWKLHGVLLQSKFTSASFRWLGTPPPAGIFGAATPSPNGHWLSMTDNHANANSDGDWPYALSVDYDGVTYTCPSSTDAGGATQLASAKLAIRDPIIINH